MAEFESLKSLKYTKLPLFSLYLYLNKTVVYTSYYKSKKGRMRV